MHKMQKSESTATPHTGCKSTIERVGKKTIKIK